MRHKTHLAISFIPLILLAGCGSTVEVVPLSKGAKDVSLESGVPYYLPMPCMLVTKNLPITRTIIQSSSSETNNDNAEDSKKEKGSEATNNKKILKKVTIRGKNTDSATDYYEFQIIYLPDIEKLYGIRITKGTGTFDSNITLEDGWKLTSVGGKSDAKTADIITAAGNAVPNAVSSILPLFGNRGPKISLAPASQPDEGTSAPSQELWIYRIGVGGSMAPIFYWSSNNRGR